MTISPTGEIAAVAQARGRRAFSLLELILVMALIGTIAAMAAPNLRGFVSAREAERAAEMLVTMTRLARTRAASEGIVFRLRFDLAENSYWLERQVGEEFQTLEDSFGEKHIMPRSVVFERVEPEDVATKEHVEFMPNGRTEAAEFFIRGRMNELISVSCSSPTERFRMKVVE